MRPRSFRAVVRLFESHGWSRRQSIGLALVDRQRDPVTGLLPRCSIVVGAPW